MIADFTAALAHRGPDDAGTETVPLPATEGRVYLGHRRLAIIDLSPAAHQPMKHPDSGDWIVFNGEIYNHRELRRELEQTGERFASNSDTEVILRGFAAWGLDVLKRLRGMFAFGLLRARDGTLLLARDRLGIKPLYYSIRPRTDIMLAFASEVRSFLDAGVVPRRLEPTAVPQFLVNGFVPEPLTMIAGVNSLLPGHYMLFSATGKCQKCATYWPEKAAPESNGRALDRQAAARRLRPVLDESLRLHLLSDVPLGAFLSGGVDSSALVALMSRIAPGRVRTFSLVFDDPRVSEEAYSRAVARKLRTQHHECRVRESEFLGLVEHGLAALDQPSTDGLNSYVVSRKCRESGLTVALAGTGGDEIFGGYSSFQRVPKSLRLARILAAIAPLRRGIAALSRRMLLGTGAPLPSTGRKGKMAALLDLPPDPLCIYHLSRMVHLPATLPLLLSHSRNGYDTTGDLPAELDKFMRLRAADFAELPCRLSVYEQMLYMGNQLLRDTDSVSMAVALEVRVPLLDHILVEAVESLPAAARFDPRQAKGLLIESLRDILPEESYRRRKQGFVLPMGRWLAGPLQDRVKRLMDDDDALRAAGLDPAGARIILDDCFAAGERIYFTRLWGLFVLVDWCRRHNLSNDAA